MKLVVYDFMDLLKQKLQEDERLLFASFPGDPYDNASWQMFQYSDRTNFMPNHNLYVCVSSSKRNERGEFRRKKENFGSGLFLMIDDLGDGLGAKNPLSIIDKLTPTCLVETSPGNHQAFYVFRDPIKDVMKFEGLINGFIAKEFLDGKDPGMRGVNRVARMPYGINGKKKYKDKEGHEWKVRPESWSPELQYTPQQLVDAFGIQIIQRKPWTGAKLATENYKERIEIFRTVYRWLKKSHMLKKEEPDIGGKIPMTCPWVDEHTDGADSGTYLAVPSEENGFCGSFVCYHSSTHNDQTGWGMLLKWAIENSEEVRGLLDQQEEEVARAIEEANESYIKGML